MSRAVPRGPTQTKQGQKDEGEKDSEDRAEHRLKAVKRTVQGPTFRPPVRTEIGAHGQVRRHE